MYDNFEKDYWSLRHKLNKFARRMLPENYAKDAVSETYTFILKYYDYYGTIDKKQYWAYQILRKMCAIQNDHRRKKGLKFNTNKSGEKIVSFNDYVEESNNPDIHITGNINNDSTYTKPEEYDNIEFIISRTPDEHISVVLDWLNGYYDPKTNAKLHSVGRKL